MSKPAKLERGPRCRKAALVVATLSALAAVPQFAVAGEGGTSHIMPGANATLVDLPPTSPGGFFKPMYINYRGDASAKVPTAAGVVANLNADANTLVFGGGYGLEQTILGDAHFSVAAFLPYTWLSISGNSAALGGLRIQNSVSGIGDLTVVPVMLAWKSDNWQYDFLMPVYAPTGSYEIGQAGQHGAELLDLRSDRRRGLQQRQVGPQCGHPPGLRDQHREQRHQLQERRHRARRRGDAAGLARSVRGSRTSAPRRGTSSRPPATAGPVRRSAASRDAPPASARCWATSSPSGSPGCSWNSSGCRNWKRRIASTATTSG